MWHCHKISKITSLSGIVIGREPALQELVPALQELVPALQELVLALQELVLAL